MRVDKTLKVRFAPPGAGGRRGDADAAAAKQTILQLSRQRKQPGDHRGKGNLYSEPSYELNVAREKWRGRGKENRDKKEDMDRKEREGERRKGDRTERSERDGTGVEREKGKEEKKIDLKKEEILQRDEKER